MEKLSIKSAESEALQFVRQGIGCNCLVFLSKSDLWDDLSAGNYIPESRIKKSDQYAAYYSVFSTLAKDGVISQSEEGYRLTELGHALKDYIGLINMLFEGYAPLMGNQGSIAKRLVSESKASRMLNGESIAEASISFGKQTVDPIIFDEFMSLTFSGTICDLGCGICTRLSEICKMTNHHGLGIDSCSEVVKKAKVSLKSSKNLLVSCQHGDITNLEGVWEDIVILMQYFVFHDFTPEKKCISIIDSFLNNFPNLKYFFYVDIVAPSDSHPQMMPGYDYVHGLMGIKTRTYEETIKMFDKSKFEIVKERPIEALPNTFLWVLSPKNNSLPAS
jgi:hypothetical protein